MPQDVLVLEDHFQHRHGGGTGQRVAAQSRTVAARREDCGHLVSRQAGANRHPAPQPLRQRHDVRGDPKVLVGEQAPGAADAGLDLIEDQQRAPLSGDVPAGLEKRRGGDTHPSFALHRLDQHRSGLGRHRRSQRVTIVERHVAEAFGQGLEALLHLLLTGGRQRGQRAPMERVQHRDDLEAARAVFCMRPTPRQLDRRFVRLRPAVAEEDLVGERMVHEGPRQFDLGFGIEQIRGMDQPQGLLLQRQRDFRMAVAEDVHGNASQKVQVLASLDVEHTRPLSSGERQGIPGVRVHQVLLSTLHQLFGEHLESWNTKWVTLSQSARLMQSKY